jgi:hypothetical protein
MDRSSLFKVFVTWIYRIDASKARERLEAFSGCLIKVLKTTYLLLLRLAEVIYQ